ncbi:AAA domain-containing protein [Candidatus Pantoea symbiotica]|jgi:hypothetical protein|uniref:AAA domain-containing protein n=1 Tax=Candidatus Pantoea symbiotica TaxID=1884370 RepID=A0A1I3SQM0_9GAMM|nr:MULTISPECIES: AAA family ATPase [Pantoea]KAJ9432606.1 AAA family ATPase [Pantoea sp. YR343]SFJ59921.1 AAA domain-containing protein [Pantoea symbiotica]SFU55233.1 AAA domain-containing protein [Pantoea sp. YR525]
MLFHNRNDVAPPLPFQSQEARAERSDLVEFMSLSDDRKAQTSVPPTRFRINDESIQLALNKLFHSKCAFCESKNPLSIHLFRPTDGAMPLLKSDFSHVYYIWLRTDWGNYYSVCSQCNANSRNTFPVSGKNRGELPSVEDVKNFANENFGLWRGKHMDRALLLNPCEVKNFGMHFSVDYSGEILALTRRAEITIKLFNLNSQYLIEERGKAYDNYMNILLSNLVREIESPLFEFKTIEFGGTWFLLLKRLIKVIEIKLDKKLLKAKSKLYCILQDVYKTPIGIKVLNESINELKNKQILKKEMKSSTPVSRIEYITPSFFELKNFKSLQSIKLKMPKVRLADNVYNYQDEAAALLILGENSSGKSSILEAIALALCGEIQRSQLGKSPLTFVLSPELMGSTNGYSPKSASVIVEFTNSAILELQIENDFKLKVTGEIDAIPPLFAYGAFRQYGANNRLKNSLGNIGTLFYSDRVLVNPEVWLLSLPDNEFLMVVRALRKILSVDEDFDVLIRDKENNRCLMVTKVGDYNNITEVKTPLSVVSSGFRSVLAMVCDVLKGLLAGQCRSGTVEFDKAKAIILIDEIEAHLHPRWKMQIMTALRQTFPNAYFIATTHDPLCLRGMYENEVVVFNRIRISKNKNNEIPIMVELIDQLPNIENLTIEQLLTSDLFSMFSTDSSGAEAKLAHLADLLAKKASGIVLKPVEEEALKELEQQVSSSLPLGSTEVERIVQKAVAEYLQRRKHESKTGLHILEEETRRSIIKALEGY